MKIEIEVSDLYLDDEQDIESGLKDFIKRETISAIWKNIKDRVESQITMEVKDTVEKEMYKKVTSFIGEIMATDTIKSKNGQKLVKINEYVIECLNDRNGWQNFEENLKKIADKLGAEIKGRYDLLFASQIVAKLNDQGLLKEDVAKLILNPAK